jgi:hypothetical protein
LKQTALRESLRPYPKCSNEKGRDLTPMGC